jgi:hypothetical protein
LIFVVVVVVVVVAATPADEIVDQSNRFVYIRPGNDDILRYLNDSRDNKQIFSGFKPSLPFIFEASRDIKGPSEDFRRQNSRNNNINAETLDNDGE